MSNLNNAVRDIIYSNLQGMTEDEARYWIENDSICEHGCVSELIYYADTEKFYNDHEEEIFALAEEYSYNTSAIFSDGSGTFKNDLAWFAFEVLKKQVFEDNLSYFDLTDID